MASFRTILRSNSTQNISMAPNWRPLQNQTYRQVFQCQEDLDALAVPQISTTDVNTTEVTEQPQECESMVDQQWFVISIVFIVLFGVAVLVIAWLAFKVYSDEKEEEEDNKGTKKSRKDGYHQTNAEEI